MNAATGGGGGTYVVDHAVLRSVADGLAAAAGAMDGAGAATPATGDLGEAGPLLTSMLAAVTEAGGRLAYEASVLSATVAECNDAASETDRLAAENYLVRGGSGG